jgi:hypothetical protein
MVIISLLVTAVGSLAIKIKGRMILSWILILVKYNTRPRFHVFNKNCSYLRIVETEPAAKTMKKVANSKLLSKVKQTPELDISDKARFEALLANPDAKLSFKTSRKGGLDVYITEVE